MASPYEAREARKARLAREFAELDPEASRDAIVASFAQLDPDLQRETIVAAMREDEAFREVEAANLYADFIADPEAERLVMRGLLADWALENADALVAASEAIDAEAITAAAQGVRVGAHFRAFGQAERDRRRNVLSREEGEAIIAASESRLRHVRHRIANADSGCDCLICQPPCEECP